MTIFRVITMITHVSHLYFQCTYVKVDLNGLEPLTSALQRRRSPN